MITTSTPAGVNAVQRAWRVRRAPAAALVLALCLPAVPARAFDPCPANLDRATPDADLIDNGDATITHTPTGLTWKRCSEGLSGANCLTGVQSFLSWSGAQAAAAAANAAKFAGHDDWRVPNYKELESIVETGCQYPSINTTRFPATTAGQYWTSTDYQYAPQAAWGVYFISGGSVIAAKDATFGVRLVRGGNAFGAFDAERIFANGFD